MSCKVLSLVTSLEVGGIETYLLRVLRYVDKDSFSFDVCYSASQAGEYAVEVRNLGCGLFRMPGKKAFFPYVWRLYRLLRSQRYDTVCDFTGDFSAASMLAAYLAGVRNRVAFYRSSGIPHRQDIARMLYRRIARCIVKRFSTQVLSNSYANFEAFYPHIKPGSGKWQIVPNGIDVSEFSPVSLSNKTEIKENLGLKGRLVIGHVGGFKPSKNHLLMLRIFDKFRHEFPNSCLLFVGDGALRKQIESEIEHRELGGYVILAGIQKSVAKYLNCADIFWFPSKYEGLPNAMIEAQSVGVPVVASDIPSVSEHVPPSGKKYLVDLNNDTGWIKALSSLAQNNRERLAQGLANRQHVIENFALGRSLDQFLSLLEGNGPFVQTSGYDGKEK